MTLSKTPNWLAKLTSGADSELSGYYSADIFLADQLLCSITLTGNYPGRAAGLAAIASLLQRWVNEFEERGHMSSDRLGVVLLSD